MRAICDAVIAALAQTPPELAQDLILNGIHLVGGGGMLRGLDRRIAKETDAAGAPRRRAARVRRARRRPLPRELRPPQGHVHGPPAHLSRSRHAEPLSRTAVVSRGLRRPGGPASRGRSSAGASAASTSGPSNGASARTARRRIGGPVVAGGEDRGQARGVADRAERGDRRLADERIGMAPAAPRRARRRPAPGCARSTSISPSAQAAVSATNGITVREQGQQPDDRARDRRTARARPPAAAPPASGSRDASLPRRPGPARAARDARARRGRRRAPGRRDWSATAASSSAASARRQRAP